MRSSDHPIHRLEGNAETAEVSEIKSKKKELEDAVQPIIAKLYAGAGAAAGAGKEEAGDEGKDEL